MKNKQRTKEQHEFMRMTKAFQNAQLPKQNVVIRERDRSKNKITVIMEDLTETTEIDKSIE